MTLEIQTKSAERVIKNFLEGISDETQRKLEPATKVSGFVIKRKIRDEIRDFAKHPTGALERSFTVRTRHAGDRATARITSQLPYALIHETGGVINVKRADWLVFKTPDGSWHSVKSVTLKAKRYITKALAASIAEVEKVYEKMLKAVVSDAARKAE